MRHIRIENVPEDVCRGQSSEWRVSAALWDLLDVHDDGGDHIGLSFKQLWSAWEAKPMGSLNEYAALLKPGLSADESARAVAALAQNTIAAGEVRRSRFPWPWGLSDGRLPALNFDGLAIGH